jgi:beta-galactosidase
MSRLLIILMLTFTFALEAGSYQPQFSTAGFFQENAKVREASNFNVGWRFIKGDVEKAHQENFNDKNWSLVNLPNGMELLPLASSGGVNYQGPCWYRKHFEVGAEFKGKKVFVHFEGIMGKSKIWVNGQLIRENFGSYFPIHLDISEHLKLGSENIIAVRADNSNDPSFPPGKNQETLDFTYFGGIYRDAWLITHGEVYVTHPLAVNKVGGGGVFVHCEDVSERSAKLMVKTDIANEGSSRNLKMILELKDKHGNRASLGEKKLFIPAKNSGEVTMELMVHTPLLWSPDHPHLYQLHVTLQDQHGQVLDQFRKRVGIRTIELRGREGFFLNGKLYPQKLIGANRHQDFAHIGHALPNNLHYRDALKLRQVGMRVIRSAHYIQDPAFMDACDELGLFMVNAIPGWQFWNPDPIFRDRMEMDVRKLVRLKRNRPSNLIWEVTPNETHMPDEFAEDFANIAHDEYPHSGFYTACDALTKRSKAQKHFDVLYSHDTDWEHEEKSVFKREWGDFVDNWVDHNSVSRVAKQWGELPQIRQAMHYFKEEWTDEGQKNYWPSLTQMFTASKALVGGTLWHSFDHQRGYHPDPFWGGIMDAYRQPKFSYHLFKSLLPTEGLQDVPNVEAHPFVYIAHLMTPFSPEDVIVFTNCDKVKLTMYGKEIGVKSAIDPNSPVPRVPVVFENAFRYVDVRNKNKKSYGQIDQKWVEGAVIKAEGMIQGKVVTAHQRWPVGRKRRLVLKVDHSSIAPIGDGSDITTVVAHLVDAGGAIKRLSDEIVRFSVEGEGELIGGPENGIHPQKMLWGEAVALVRSGARAGKIKVKAELIRDGMNLPDSAEVTFTTMVPQQKLLYSELPSKDEANLQAVPRIDESKALKSLREELRKTQKALQEYRLNEVGRQQQDFLQ